MDSFEWNKIAGWVLAAATAILSLSIVTNEIYHPDEPETPAYVVEGVELETDAGGEAEAEQPVEFFLANAVPEAGAAQFKKCAACHTIEKGGATGIGPNLYGIVGANIASVPGFNYSSALADLEGEWTFERLFAWIHAPRKFAPGNKMSFAGMSKPEDRANLIAYLNQYSDTPLPIPAAPPPQVDTAEAAAPADGEPTPAAEKDIPAPGRAPKVPVAEVPNVPPSQRQTGGPAAPGAGGY